MPYPIDYTEARDPAYQRGSFQTKVSADTYSWMCAQLPKAKEHLAELEAMEMTFDKLAGETDCDIPEFQEAIEIVRALIEDMQGALADYEMMEGL